MIGYRKGIVLTVLLGACMNAVGEVNEYTLTPHYSDAVISKADLFRTSSGEQGVAFGLEYPDKPSAIGVVLNRDGVWSSPIVLPADPLNDVQFDGVVNLADGTPMQLVHGNDTDYAKLLNIPAGAAIEDYIEQIKPYAQHGTRLFSRVEINGMWSRPIAIPNSYGAQTARIAAGHNDGAAVIFLNDGDQNVETTADVRLNVALFQNHGWQVPFAVVGANDGIPLAAQITAIKQGYLATWVTRETSNNWTLHSATISSETGSVSSTSSAIFTDLPTAETPFLTSDNGAAHLFWLNRGPEGDLRLYRADYDTDWSQPKLLVENHNAKLVNAAYTNLAGQDGLIYLTSSQLNAGVVNSDTMRLSIVPVGTAPGWRDLGAMRYATTSDQLLALATIKSTPSKEGLEPEYYLKLFTYPIAQDLSVTLKQKTVATKPNTNVGFVALVENVGLKRSGQFTVAISSSGEKRRTFTAESLDIGKSKEFSFEVPVTAVETPVAVDIETSVSEDPQNNNHATSIVRIKPDYAVEKVERIDAGHLLVHLSENIGISAPIVPVELYLEEDGKPERIASTEFNPNNASPILLETAMLAGKTERYKVIAKVNEDHSIPESDYGNNQRAYVFEPLPDYYVERVSIDADNQVGVVVRNSGAYTSDGVSVLVTDNVEMAASPVAQEGGVYRTVILQDGVAAFTVPLSELGQAGDVRAVYVVVNPQGQLLELDRNNNLYRLSMAEAIKSDSGAGSETVLPMTLSASSWCDRIDVAAYNRGDDIVISPVINLSHAGSVMARRTLPAVMAGDEEYVSFAGVAPGEYSVDIEYRLGERNVSSSAKVSVTAEPYCAGASDNNVQLISVQMVAPPSSSETQASAYIRIGFSVSGFTTEYRKPLVKLPIRITLSQGTQRYLDKMIVRYVPVLEDSEQQLVVEIPADQLPSGPYDLTVQILPRNDEAIRGDNLQVVRMTGDE